MTHKVVSRRPSKDHHKPKKIKYIEQYDEAL